MTTISKEEIKEIRVNWDWQVAIIPSEYVKRLQYNEVKRDWHSIECSEVILELDLDYIKTHDITDEINDEMESKVSIFDEFQKRNIWDIEVIKNSQKITLTLPSNRKESYCSTEEFLTGWDAINSCEVHNIEKDTYKMEWKEAEEQDVYMSNTEWSNFFKKGKLTKISSLSHQLGIELLSQILAKNKEENFEMIRRIHEVDDRRRKVYGIKKGYTISEEYYPLHDLDIVILNAKNHSYHWNFNFVLVPDFEKEEQDLYKVIEEGIPNEDTKNYFSRTIIVHDEKDKLQEEMLEYLNEDLLFTTYQELNKMWYDIRKEWKLL